MSELLAACERIVERARTRVAQVEVCAMHDRGGSVEIEKGELSGANWEETRGFGIRVVLGARVGFAYATTEEEAAEALEAAVRASRLGKRRPGFAFSAGGRAVTVPGLYDKRLAERETDELLEDTALLSAAVQGVRKDLTPVMGGLHVGVGELAVANSEGLARSTRSTGLGGHIYVVQRRDGVSTGFASRESARWDVDWESVGREAGELAVKSANPVKLEKGGPRECLIRPESASDLLSTITVPSLYARPAHRGESFYSGKVGKKVADARVSLVDDPLAPRGLGSTPFDDEGTPTREIALLRRGVLRTFLYNREDAAEWNGRTTGHAVRTHPFDGRSFKSPPGTAAHQMRLEAPSRSTEKLIAGMDDGLVVHDLMGVHTANATSGDFSVTSSVLFRVRRGAIEGAVAPVGIAGNLHAALSQGVRIGDDVKRMGGTPAWQLPSVWFPALSVTP